LEEEITQLKDIINHCSSCSAELERMNQSELVIIPPPSEPYEEVIHINSPPTFALEERILRV